MPQLPRDAETIAGVAPDVLQTRTARTPRAARTARAPRTARTPRTARAVRTALWRYALKAHERNVIARPLFCDTSRARASIDPVGTYGALVGHMGPCWDTWGPGGTHGASCVPPGPHVSQQGITLQHKP